MGLCPHILGENYPRAERNMWRMFKIVGLNRPNVEIYQIYYLYMVKKHQIIALL